ncbi:hypothetical protein J7L05_00290 [bacterium]|nr:hypothetical protein [bacterium]
MKTCDICKFLTLLFILIIIAGCSSSGVNPVNPPQTPVNSGELDNGIIIAGAGDSISGEGILGLYDFHIDLDNLDASLVPFRSSSAGTSDSAETDCTSFLLGTPCADCVQITGISLDTENRPVVKIGIRHPFPPGDLSGPPSTSNRLDLHVFNVRGFIISDGFEGVETFSASGKSIPGFDLYNRDGLSGEFDEYWDNYLMTEANLHPYILHFDNYGVGNFDAANENGFTDLKNPEGNLVMKMGSDLDIQDYVFELSGTGSFDFLYALTASYGISSAKKTEKLTPTYRIPQYNSKPASEVRVTGVDDSELFSGDTGSSCTITLEIKDINHGVTIGNEIDQMSADSSVSKFVVEIPGVTDPIWETTSPDLFYVSGDGRIDSLVYDIVVTNDAGADAGIYSGLIGVVDAFKGAGNLEGNAIYGLPPGGDPTESFFTVDEWVTYTTVDVEVFTSCGPITGSITEPISAAITINNGDIVNFDSEGSSANGGDPITEYYWTWGDGTMPSIGQSGSHQFFNDNCETTMESVIYTVALRLTDSCEPPNVEEVDSLQVTVECPDCVNLFENFDGGTDGDWLVDDWSVENTDNSGFYYGGWDEFSVHNMGPNCANNVCYSGNCFFTSGDNVAQGNPPGFCNDYSGDGHYYLISPVIDMSSLTVTEASMTVYHFYNVLDNPVPDGCAAYVSTNGGISFPTQLLVLSGETYNGTFTSGLRNGDNCFTGLVTTGNSAETVFDLTPFIGESQVVIRFEQINNNTGAVGTPGYPVGWWIDEITIAICP